MNALHAAFDVLMCKNNSVRCAAADGCAAPPACRCVQPSNYQTPSAALASGVRLDSKMVFMIAQRMGGPIAVAAGLPQGQSGGLLVLVPLVLLAVLLVVVPLVLVFVVALVVLLVAPLVVALVLAVLLPVLLVALFCKGQGAGAAREG
ncbi:MAG: hypothetical protein J3K34DRAFT_431958 [Monoraphidium minutum]|nr:MAG: hypothetical protein J3K34DRAFT_431958 [Monoraphidium minutum]